MQNALGFLPGEGNWMDGKPMPGQTPPMQEKKPNAAMNALGAAFQIFAPQGYAAGKQQYTDRQIGNALSNKDYGGAADVAYKAGDLNTGLQLGQMGQDAASAQRKQEAQGVLNLFSAAKPEQITEMAMSDPVGFERMTGMTADEYMQAGQRMVQAGLSPEQFHQHVIQKAQAELGISPAGPVEGKAINDQLVNPYTGQVMGDFRSPEEPQGPMSTIGKLRADLDAGRITPEEYDIAVARLQKEDPSLSVQFGEGGALSGITYGSSNKGKDAALVRTPDNTAAVSPGEQQARYNKVLATNKTLDVSDGVVAEDIDRAIGMAGAWTTGFVGAKLEDLQGTPAHDLKMLLQSIKSNVGFDKLQQMRDNSPTGGALGQVTELELGLLQSVYGALEQSQTKEQFVYNLQRLKQIKSQFAQLRAEAFAMDYPDLQTTAQFRSDTNQQVSDWTDADEARLRELEAMAGGQQQ